MLNLKQLNLIFFCNLYLKECKTLDVFYLKKYERMYYTQEE